MTVLGAVHISPILSIPIAIVLSLAVGWYWRRLGEAEVPSSRRRIRRVSLGIITATGVMLIVALSFADPRVRPTLYLVSWWVVLLLLAMTVVTAIIDMVNNLRLQQYTRQALIVRAAVDAAKLRQTGAPKGDDPAIDPEHDEEAER